MRPQDSRRWGPFHLALLGVALAGGCAVYEIPTLAGAPVGAAEGSAGFGDRDDGEGSAGAPADLDGWGGQPGSIDVGEAGATDRNDEVGGAGNGGTAGASDDGAAGSSHGEGQGGDGGTAGASGGRGSAAGGSSCAAGWRNQSACEQCATQVQPDLQACAVILDCYVSKSCGPSTCSTTDQKCGPNVLGEGAAAYSIAKDVYTCLCN